MRGTIQVSVRIIAAIFCFFTFYAVYPGASYAHGGCSCTSIEQKHSTTRDQVCDCYQSRMDQHEEWMINDFWPLLEEALKGSASQQTQGEASAMQGRGMMMDADNHVDTRRAREQEVIQTQRRYGGAEHAICTPASIGQGVVASSELAKGAGSTITKLMLKNGSGGGRAKNGAAADRQQRFGRMMEYCTPEDFGGIGAEIGCAADPRTDNLDLSFPEILDGRDTDGDSKIGANDFFNGTIDTPEEEGAWDAFTTNLGLQNVFDTIDVDKLNQANAALYKDILVRQRQYMARRSVAMAAFNNIQRRQRPGSDAATEYLRGLYSEQGRDPSVIPNNPSLQQQEKIVYHDYYADVNLYVQKYTESPENVTRMQAVALAHMNAQLWNISELLRRIDAGIAANTLRALDGEYNAIQQGIRRIGIAQ